MLIKAYLLCSQHLCFNRNFQGLYKTACLKERTNPSLGTYWQDPLHVNMFDLNPRYLKENGKY